jgi:hypothetical protein
MDKDNPTGIKAEMRSPVQLSMHFVMESVQFAGNFLNCPLIYLGLL